MNRIAVLVAIAAAACGRSDRAVPTSAPTPLAHASPADLAGEIAAADRLGTWRALAERWQGQTVRWTVTRQRLLCRSADDCNVAAFPIQRPARQGWMPDLGFAPGQYDILVGLCGDRDACDVAIEGTLSQLEVSPELPTRVRLSNVRIVSPSPATGPRTARG